MRVNNAEPGTKAQSKQISIVSMHIPSLWENPLMFAQVIIRKRKTDGRTTDGRRTDGQTHGRP